MNLKSKFPGYLCPVCVVRFPYSEKLAQHWKFFHGRSRHGRLRSCPPIGYAVSQQQPRESLNNGRNKQLFQVKIFHNYKTQTVNEHVPHVCLFCEDIIWNCAKICTDCGYVCHVECQRLVVTLCQNRKMHRETHSIGESSKDYSLSSPPLVSRSMSASPTPDGNMELDLTYITDRLIAMSFPASGLESVYRTNLLGVLKMLQSKHMEKYRVINVSERRYDILQLNEPGQVLDYGWPDHLAPPFHKLNQIIKSIDSWLSSDIANVAVIHCKGGKSRIGVVIASYIQFSKNSPSPQGALDWFALKHYYDSKIEGAIQPSQKRYVHYFGEFFNKELKNMNKSLILQNIILHEVPYHCSSTGLQLCMKIYQGYQLKHTTKVISIPPSSKRCCINIEDGIKVEGDVMIKCIQTAGPSQHVIFRLQFHMDAVSGCVAVFGKYDLDEAFKDPAFPDSCYIEFIFAPAHEKQRLEEKAECIDKKREQVSHNTHKLEQATQNKHKLDALIQEMLVVPPPQNGKLGIFNMEMQMTGMLESDRGNLMHVPGPVDGNPYAQIDHSLKGSLRTKPLVDPNKPYNLSRGIEDLDSLLGELGYLATEPGVNANTHVLVSGPLSNKSIKTIHNQKQDYVPSKNLRPSIGEIKHAPVVMEGKITVEKYGVLHQAPTLHCRQESSGSSSTADDVFSTPILSPTVDDLLFELDNSTLNSSNSYKPQKFKKSHNVSAYDNDSCSDTVDSRDESIEDIMEIQPGTVAQHVKSLNRVLFGTDNEYNRKMGVPLAGLVSPELVEKGVTKFNSRSVAPGYCSPYVGEVYHSQGVPSKINYDVHPHHKQDKADGSHSIMPTLHHVDVPHSKQNGHAVRYDSDYAEIPSPDEISQPQHSVHRFNEEHIKNDPLSRSDSAYGESMRSSSSSPLLISVVPSQRSYNSSNNNNKTFTYISAPYSVNKVHADVNPSPAQTYNQPPTVQTYNHHNGESFSHRTESYSPRSDGNNGKSSGIGSMTSLDDEYDASGYTKIDEMNSIVIIKEENVSEEAEEDVEISINEPEIPVKTVPQKRSLTIVEEKIQPAHIQKEVESLNDDIFKQLFEDDTKLTSDVLTTTAKMPSAIPTFNDRLTTSSNEDEVQTTELQQELKTTELLQRQQKESAELQLRHQQEAELLQRKLKESAELQRRHQPYLERQQQNIDRHQEENSVLLHQQEMKNHPMPILKSISLEPSPAVARRFPNASPIPDNSIGIHIVDQQPSFDRALSWDSSISEEGNSPKSPNSGKKFNSLRYRRLRNSGSSNSSVSSAELFHEVARYPSIKFEKDTMNLWYKPGLSREEATNMLREKEAGTFVVRDSQSYEGAFGLAVKVETPPIGVLQQAGGDLTKIDLDNELVRHFLIEPCKKGVRLKGSNNEPAFPSLVALIYQHSLTKMALPVSLVIPEIDVSETLRNGMKTSCLTESQLLQKGAACNLVYLGRVDVESLTGDGAVQYAINKVLSQNATIKTTVVNIKVNQQGITLTDNQRKLFFRRHYPMRNALHCGVDPKGRTINLKTIVQDVDRDVGCFGFVVRKQKIGKAASLDNECHICAEVDVDQPASAVINFIHKAMRYAKV